LSTLYIRLLSHASALRLDDIGQLNCPFALVTDGGAIVREGEAALADLGPIIGQSQRVTLLPSASDVSVLRIRVPPLSPARLRAALPNLLEEKLMTDPADCVMVAGDTVDGLRTIAVVQRAWLEQLVGTLTGLGAREIAVLPAQLCVPHQDGVVSAAIAEHSSDLELVIRLNATEGIGIAILPEQAASAAQEAIEALCAIVPDAPIALYVPQASVPAYRDVLEHAALNERVSLFADNWLRWTAGARSVNLNLMSGFGSAGGGGLNWRPWRFALVCGVLAVLVNVVALNIDWLRMRREAVALQNGMVLAYKATFPKETIVPDPIFQMRQKIAASQRASGQAAPDDFTTMLAAFSDAWGSVMQGNQALLIAGVEYHDRGLVIKLKPDASAPTDKIKTALASHHLTLSQPNAGVWQIRSAK
jgi:general secretion pathway protein L